MSAVTNIWRQLVQRRLWPVAILLIAALVAVPLTLAKQPTPPAPQPAPAANDDGASELAVNPIVAKASAEERTKRRRVLGAAKNPFAKKAVDDGVTASTAPTGTTQTTNGPGGDSQPPAIDVDLGAGGGGSAPVPSDPVPPVGITPPAEPKPPAKKHSVHELTVRFGDATTGGERRTLERLQPLPSAEEPLLIYLGVDEDGKTAVFLVDHGVQAIGDGECMPFPEQCETVRMRAGDTEFFDVVDETGNVSAQYQLDLLKIHHGKSASAAKASSKAGRRALMARASLAGSSAGLR